MEGWNGGGGGDEGRGGEELWRRGKGGTGTTADAKL